LLRHGLTVVTLQPEREYSWEGISENPFLLMEIVLYQIRANEESGTKSRRVKASWEGRRRNLTSRPATSRCPSWIKIEGGKFVLIPDRAAVVRRIFDLAIAGHGNFTVAKILNAEGVPSFTGKPWHMVYVHHLLRSKTTVGEYQPQTRGDTNKGNLRKGRQNVGQPVPDYYPRVVSDEIF
jgi:hypothetical protein